MTDLVERLRARAEYDDLALLPEAADEIERLRARLNNIAKNPDTPELIRQYAAGMLEPKP